MKSAYIILALLSFFSFQNSISAQDKILMMSGQELDCVIIDDLGIEVRYEFTKKNGKKKEKYMHKSEIFSVTKQGKEEEVYYSKDELLGDWMTEYEMRIYMAGEQDARAAYNAKPTILVGFGVGDLLAALAQGGLVFTIAGPVLYTLFHLIPKIKIKESTITNPDHQYNEMYALGYERVARSRKIIGALKGSAAGMFTGVVNYLIFSQR